MSGKARLKSRRRWVLGCGLSDHDCSAVLMHGNEIVVGIAKERLTRRKRHGCDRNDFDEAPVSYCLEAAGIGIDEVDLVVQSSVFTFLCDDDYYKTLGHYPRSVGVPPRPIDLRARSVRCISHHLAHAYSAFYPSPFEEAVVLVVDAMGNEDFAVRDFFEGEDHEWMRASGVLLSGAFERESCYVTRGGRLVPLWKRTARNAPPHDGEIQGLGIMYHDISEYIFGNGHEAGQTMGLAPYGDPREYQDFSIVDLTDVPPYLRFNDEWRRRFARAYTPAMDPRRLRWADCWDEFRHLAAKAQLELEKALLHLCRRLHRDTGISNLCFAGGVALNSVANMKILEETPFEQLFIPPAAGDSGIALGCALYGHQLLGGQPAHLRYTNDYLGRAYGDERIVGALEASGLAYERCREPATTAARLLAQGKILGWFQGGSEFGPRALGHRSILCAPRPAEMRERLNARVKHRASFRPFAPSVLAERASDYFELVGDSPFMLLVARVRSSKWSEIPAVVHVDGTARLQTVTRQENDRFYELIAEFDRLTGTPVVLNTSFNDQGEPIVETPVDAIRCFRKTELDALVLGDYLITRGGAGMDNSSGKLGSS